MAPPFPTLDSRESSKAERLAIDDKNSLLLGIKYEAAKLGGVEGDPLRAIEEQLAKEVGDDWASDQEVVAGRNAVRREHDLPGLGESGVPPSPAPARKRSLWRRLMGG